MDLSNKPGFFSFFGYFKKIALDFKKLIRYPYKLNELK
jgi:hypothetical protein